MNAKNIGFISFRFAGTDGVTLEAKKWVEILENEGHNCFFLGGEMEFPPHLSLSIPEFHFKTPEIRSIYRRSFSCDTRDRDLTDEIYHCKERIKNHIYAFIERFRLDVLIPQNILAIPLNIPLGVALTEVIAETAIPTIAHHHDFFWERKRFLRNCIWDILNASYPPHITPIQHVVINSSGANQLALRSGISSTTIPNVMPFENPPSPPDAYAKGVRENLGIGEDEILVLQPTRVVQRKGIEHSIELVSRLGLPASLVISHASGDEGYEYQSRIRDYASLMKVKTIFVQEQISSARGTTLSRKKIFTLSDLYSQADLVTYPSLSEGFGNAFLEAIFFRKPVLVNNYSIYSFDIRPKGFQVIEMDEFITKETVANVLSVLADEKERARCTEVNYALGLAHYSYGTAKEKLTALLDKT